MKNRAVLFPEAQTVSEKQSINLDPKPINKIIKISIFFLLSLIKNKMVINNGEIGEISQKLYDQLTGIQWGSVEDKMHWTVEVK